MIAKTIVEFWNSELVERLNDFLRDECTDRFDVARRRATDAAGAMSSFIDHVASEINDPARLGITPNARKGHGRLVKHQHDYRQKVTSSSSPLRVLVDLFDSYKHREITPGRVVFGPVGDDVFGGGICGSPLGSTPLCGQTRRLVLEWTDVDAKSVPFIDLWDDARSFWTRPGGEFDRLGIRI